MMNRRMTVMTLLLLLLASSGIVRSTSVAAQSGPSASGHGNLTVGGELRTFSFHAREDKNGVVQGSATLHNRATDTFIKLDIDCLRIVGNTATMSGIIEKSDNPALEGQRGIFRVQDNGEGADNPADRLSLLFIFPPNVPLDCNSNVGFPLLPIEGGNIQVRP